VKDKFPDAQLFLELRGVSETPVTAIEAMSRIILDFHPETGKLPDTEAELLPLYRSVLHGKRALIVLDNAKDESQVKPLLSAGPPAAFLITSRNALMLDGVEGVRLDVLPPDDAFKMLREIVGAKGTNADLRTVAELCGWLPLALRVAGDFLRLHENWTVPRYTEALRDEAKRLERLKGKTADRDVEAVLALSAIELVRENPERAERWQVLSVFPADFNAKAAAAVWELDENATLDELTAFLDRNLLQHDVDTNRYDLHDLMRPVARDTFEYVDNHPLQASVEVRVRTAERHFAQHYSEVLAFSNHLYLQGGDKFQLALTLFDRESPNIRYAQAWAVRRFDENLEDRFAAELCVRFALTSPFTGDLRLTSLEKIRWLESAVAGSRTIGNKHWEGMALGNLGCVHANLGDARTAISFHKQNLAVAREIKDSRSEGNALGNLGNAHLYLGDANTAITFHQQNLTVTREIGDRRGEGNALGNLGIAYAALGDTHTAITFYEQSLVVSREIGDRRHVGTTFGNLGNAHVALGDANTAISFHEQFLEIAREIGDRRGEGTSLGNLGNAYAELGDARRAVTFYDQQLTITRDIGDRRGEGNASWNMAVALDLLGQHDDAVRHAANALAIREAIEDPNTEKVRRKLAEWRGEE
jgi:tetratricopeptide (TPR) repeat protein